MQDSALGTCMKNLPFFGACGGSNKILKKRGKEEKERKEKKRRKREEKKEKEKWRK